jgi:hypothetical protein
MIGSIGSGLASAAADYMRGGETAADRVAPADATVADHVAALDEQEPIRSAHTTQGTLVDTYL